LAISRVGLLRKAPNQKPRLFIITHALSVAAHEQKFTLLGQALTRLRPKPVRGESSGDIPTSDAVSYEDFGKWISRRRSEIATYLNQRMHNKYRMSGHAYSGFHGTFSFLTKNPDIGRTLLGQRALPIPDGILAKLAAFVRSHGAKFGGPRGGTWRSKLSTQLGGLQIGGGAGDVLVKRLLIEVPRYMHEKHLL
jgi:hypothetical protein